MKKRDKTEYIIVHHSATARDHTTFEAIKRHHIYTNGWDNVGYHRVIEGDGTVYSGMPTNMVGYHCKYNDFNHKSVAVCLTGDFRTEWPSEAQLASLADIIGEWRDKYNIPRERVLGHRETGAATACPGDHLVDWLKNYRKEADIDKMTEEDKEIIEDIIHDLRNAENLRGTLGTTMEKRFKEFEEDVVDKSVSNLAAEEAQHREATDRNIETLLEGQKQLRKRLETLQGDLVKIVETNANYREKLDKKIENWEEVSKKENGNGNNGTNNRDASVLSRIFSAISDWFSRGA